jgi:hypothetical protein
MDVGDFEWKSFLKILMQLIKTWNQNNRKRLFPESVPEHHLHVHGIGHFTACSGHFVNYNRSVVV